MSEGLWPRPLIFANVLHFWSDPVASRQYFDPQARRLDSGSFDHTLLFPRLIGLAIMVHFRVVGSHDDARTFIMTLTSGGATHSAGGSKGRVAGGTLLGKKHDNATITLSYTLSTKRMPSHISQRFGSIRSGMSGRFAVASAATPIRFCR